MPPLPLEIRFINVFKFNHIREPILQNPEPIKNSHPKDSVPLETILETKSVPVTVLPKKQNHGLYVRVYVCSMYVCVRVCVDTYAYRERQIHLKELVSAIVL